MHNKRVMVVGGTGLFGQPVVQAFQRKGFEPVILSHDEKKAQKRFSGSCNIRYADVTNPGSLKGIFDDISSLHI
ncbi:MAG: NAD-dependent epimerase/dehydratase family protein, partial [Bacteroidota bacterium]